MHKIFIIHLESLSTKLEKRIAERITNNYSTKYFTTQSSYRGKIITLVVEPLGLLSQIETLTSTEESVKTVFELSAIGWSPQSNLSLMCIGSDKYEFFQIP